jgi:AraC family transcriptional regulator
MADERSADPSQLQRRAEYLGRIQRVVDFIEAHLGQELNLDDLARVACFSPFHFHRIFGAVMGEPLYQFILRLRLERAAGQLAQDNGKSITAIALDCGFGGSAAFARAFRSAFGTSASAFRAAYRKICKTDGKEGKEAAAADPYAEINLDARTQPAMSADEILSRWRIPMPSKAAQSVRVENVPVLNVAYVRHVGPYAGNSALFEGLIGKLMRWAGPRGLVGPNTKTIIVYHDNPEITAPEKLRTSMCLVVPPGTPVEGEIGTMEIAGGTWAMARFELDSSEFGAAWNWLCGSWLPESGYQPEDGPAYESCLNDPRQHPQGKHIVDLCLPVRPL